ncbi:MAG: hypothetical protein ACFFCM_06945 [Promethearchaeota archaeon]
MEDPISKLRELFKDTDEITLNDISINAEKIGFEIKTGTGGIPPQIPIHVNYNNQIFSGMILENTKNVIRKKE